MASREAGEGRETEGNGGQVLGPEKKPGEVGPFPLDPDIVHFTGEGVVVYLGSSSRLSKSLLRLSWLGEHLLCARPYRRRVPTVCRCLR